MVIVHIVEAFGGGVYTYLKDLSSFFSKEKDIETIIIYSSKRDEAIGLTLQPYSNVKWINIDMERNINPIKDFKSIVAIRKILKQYKPNIIHLHSSKAGVLGRFASINVIKRHNIFYSPHGYSFLSHEFSNKKKKLFYAIEKYSQKILGGTTVACGDTELEIANEIGKGVLVRNGIDFNKMGDIIPKRSNTKLTVGTLGRISIQKNPMLFNEIALRFPEFNFIWIGYGDLKDLLTAPNITITGWLTNKNEILSHLSGLDIYIQTSSWEGLPIAVLEAMALSKPVIATNIIGNKDVVLNDNTGFLFNKIDELGEIFKKLESSSIRIEYGENGLKRCKDLFDITKNFQDLKEIYHTSICEKNY